MVVTRKTPVAPVPTGSRNNTAQPLPRAAKPKSTLAELDPLLAAKNAASSEKTHSKSKHKNRQHKKAPKPPRNFLDTMVYLSLLFLGLYAFTICPADTKLSNPVCRSLSQYRAHVLEPYVLPPLHRALAHPAVAPYVARAESVVDKTAPYAAAVARAASHTADVYVLPAYRRYVVPQWRAHVVPQWRKHVVPQWRTHAAPRIAQAAPYARAAQRTLERTAFTLHKTYTVHVKPFVLRAYALARPHVVNGYRVARPRAVALYARAAAEAGRARRAYVDPHVVRIWAKVLELSGAEPAGAATTAETAATTLQPTSAQVIKSKGRTEAEVTPVKAAESSAAATPEEAVPAPSSSSVPPAATETASSVPPAETETASSVAPPPPAETPAAETTAELEDAATSTPAAKETAASVAAQSAHGMESAVVQEILASSAPPASSSSSAAETAPSAAVETPTPEIEAKTAASVAAQSAHGMESAVVQEILDVPEPFDADDAETDDFLSGLGLALDEPEPEFPDDGEEYDADGFLIEPVEPEPEISDEELAALKTADTAAKRADLEGRMAGANARLTALVAERRKALRKALVAARKVGVARVAGVKAREVGGLEAEAERMLKGLEGYVRKEEKATAGKGGAGGVEERMERMERWERVVARVEEKLGERVRGAQGALQAVHVEEKEGEVNEGMAIIQEVKDACGQAQGSVGLDLSWLDDVTYLDWQVYHDLARIGENFQAEASEIQAGTHAHPPVDPFVPAVQAAQTELNALVERIVARISALRTRAGAAFAGVVPGAVAAEAVVEEKEEEKEEQAEAEEKTEEEEPAVSILPIVPEAPKTGAGAGAGAGAAENVILGKSAEQVAEALRDVPLEKAPAPVHEEL
ncbi:hypothetical protein B0H17DRAFT_1191410 [Mycena rosella]|uniref:Uncharacterized protein n=1 Tax=Mycena rosella TaxID=1033263 RepID=A0AAD7H0G1_MYCRO|nr:hypothetical protein B0H17DRAFT_1191410 [Mycena rosella]